MSLLFMDGFDHYATADAGKKWSSVAGSFSISAGAGRRGTSALNITAGNQSVRAIFAAGVATLIVGFAWKPANVVGGNPEVMCLADGLGGVTHISLVFNASNKLEIRRGAYSGTLLATSTTVFSIGAYYYLELKVTVSDTVGIAVLRVNGTTDINLSGADTRNGGNATVDTVVFGANFGSAFSSCFFDDIYICDTAGSAPNNDFLGDCRIDTLFPNADGSNQAFTPSTPGTHYTLVDEPTPNTTDYVESNVVASKDTYGFQDLTTITGTIYGVQVNTAALKDDAGARSLANTVKSSASNADGVSRALGTSQIYYMDVFPTDPATTAAWTEAGVNAAEFGVKVIS